MPVRHHPETDPDVVYTKCLETPAVDQGGRTYLVCLQMYKTTLGTPKRPDYKWILSIEETPGKWYMSTLLEQPHESWIYLDQGQKWFITNLDKLMEEAVHIL